MSFLFRDETLFFSVWPRDITGLLMRFVEKRFLQDSNADEFVVVSRERYVKYYHHQQLRWCSAFSSSKIDVLLWGDDIIVVTDSHIDHAVTGHKYTASVLHKQTGTCYMNFVLNFELITSPLVIHASRLVNNAEHRWTY
jgi:hypothetical protein